MDPLSADEILARRQHPAAGPRGPAGRDLPEHRAARAVRRHEVLGCSPRQRPGAPHGDRVLPPEQEELQDHRQPERRRRSRRRCSSRPSEGQLGLTITEVSDFSFVFQDPAFLSALALRGIAHAAAAAEGLRHAADAGLVRPARGGAAHRQGADVLHRGRRHQPLRAADRRAAGDHRPRRAPHRQAASTPASCRSPRPTHNFDEASIGARYRPAAGAEADPHQPAARAQLPHRRQLHRVAEVALPRPLRDAAPGRWSRSSPTTGAR